MAGRIEAEVRKALGLVTTASDEEPVASAPGAGGSSRKAATKE
jgi:hypothetical protein